ncbi:MAG TPA: FliM/FliN family flagellar motor switch protein [Planctomycetota bacterium]|nr:FliM/FliN family flagellar motor switch protein [Planctomycetota bacterium]
MTRLEKNKVEVPVENQQTEKETLDSLLRKVERAPRAAGPGAGAMPVFEDLGTTVDDIDEDSRRPRADLLKGVHLKVRAELGRTHILLKDALQLAPGSVVDLAKLADDPVDLYVNDLLIARGEVLVVNECFCVRVTEVFSSGGEEEC